MLLLQLFNSWVLTWGLLWQPVSATIPTSKPSVNVWTGLLIFSAFSRKLVSLGFPMLFPAGLHRSAGLLARAGFGRARPGLAAEPAERLSGLIHLPPPRLARRGERLPAHT